MLQTYEIIIIFTAQLKNRILSIILRDPMSNQISEFVKLLKQKKIGFIEIKLNKLN